MATDSVERFRLVGHSADDRSDQFARDVVAGLTASPKYLACRYFYDRLGSRLFEAICELPEYYLTRAEASILRAHADEIAALFGDSTDLIELGSGTAAKTRLLIDAFSRRQGRLRFVPVDICSTVLEESSRELLRTYPQLEIVAIVGEYREALEHVGAITAAAGAKSSPRPDDPAARWSCGSGRTSATSSGRKRPASWPASAA